MSGTRGWALGGAWGQAVQIHSELHMVGGGGFFFYYQIFFIPGPMVVQ